MRNDANRPLSRILEISAAFGTGRPAGGQAERKTNGRRTFGRDSRLCSSNLEFRPSVRGEKKSEKGRGRVHFAPLRYTNEQTFRCFSFFSLLTPEFNPANRREIFRLHGNQTRRNQRTNERESHPTDGINNLHTCLSFRFAGRQSTGAA